MSSIPAEVANLVERSTPNRESYTVVQRMLSLQNQLPVAKTPVANTAIQRGIDATDGQIDRLVYQLYELTDDEIKIVEEATG